MIIFNVFVESYIDNAHENSLKHAGWRITRNGMWSKPFIGITRQHAISLASADLSHITNGAYSIENSVITARQNYELTPMYKWRLVPNNGRARSYKYESSALYAKRRLGGQLFKALDLKEVWEPVT